ncbi:putative amino acid permease YhdG [Lacunisphaera limnophila]|uniref:Putative amino acid permease YhdG n=1 Tax=Lacunisphaera limnophila TaxID=1838286 RepID=A0A1D8AXP0_9BACT|nr:amino acid permease [Lacunisphaera limnophila]AOS45640.1 putative amino acid permease YhdG [Lacunisphaera limnophila]
MSLLRTKSIASLQAEASAEHGYKRTLGPLSLISLGIGSVVGAGIFVQAGQSAALYAGPAIALSFIVSGIACLFAGLCYAELAAMIPVSGSAYTYTYGSLGEFFAWVVGWCLVLEYLFSGAAVAVSWSGATRDILREFNVALPDIIARAPLDVIDGRLVTTGALINFPAVFISLLLTYILYIGIKESANFNNLMVIVKVGVLLALIGYGIWYFFGHRAAVLANWTPFVPANTGTFGEFGWSGIFRGAGAIFFAYVGFDCVSSAAQETKNPQRDLPIGLLGTLAAVSFLFIAVSLVLTGVVPYAQLNVDAPFIFALQQIEAPAYFRYLIEAATLAGLTSVILVSLLGQPRIFYSMARDGLLPAYFAKIHPKYGTPHITTWITGISCAIISGLFPLNVLGELVSIGTLLAFALVCAGVLVLRRTQPDLPRPFRTPWVPAVPVLGVVICVLQMFSLPAVTWINLIVWMGLGLAIYFGYSRRHSHLAR